jgi:hypothetical protein
MNWPLAECLQYRTAYWLIEGREVRSSNSTSSAQSFAALAG